MKKKLIHKFYQNCQSSFAAKRLHRKFIRVARPGYDFWSQQLCVVRRRIRCECGKQRHLESTESVVKTMPFLTRLCTAHLRGHAALAAPLCITTSRFISSSTKPLSREAERTAFRDSITPFTATSPLPLHRRTFCYRVISFADDFRCCPAVPLSFECHGLISSGHRRQIVISNCDNERFVSPIQRDAQRMVALLAVSLVRRLATTRLDRLYFPHHFIYYIFFLFFTILFVFIS